MKPNEITGEMMNRAVAIYLKHAYRGKLPPTFAIPRFEPGETLAQILARPHAFEDQGAAPAGPAPGGPAPGGQARSYALRLGNQSYPHMKLAIVEAFFRDEFVFTVDRHDSFQFEPDTPGYEAWCQLKELNRLFKETIERAWHEAGLPTMQRLREAQAARQLKAGAAAQGATVLILDDDVARAGAVGNILIESGYDAVVGPPGHPPNPDGTAFLAAQRKARGDSVRLPASAWKDPVDILDLRALIGQRRVVLIVLDVSYWTGQGPRIASALRLDMLTQEIPILGIYSRRDLGLDPDVFSASLRRPYTVDALLSLIGSLVKGAAGEVGRGPRPR